MATEQQQIREWNDETSWAEIVKFTDAPTTNVLVVAREFRIVQATIEHQLDAHYRDGQIDRYSITGHTVHFVGGKRLFLTTVDRVLAYVFRGCMLNAIYLVDSFTWTQRQRDTVQQELLPALGRR